MPRKLFRRFLPDPHKVRQYRVLQWLGPAINDPNLFHINRNSVSQSFFIGLFCAFLPLPGQTLIAALLALGLRTNLPLAVALIWISNPLTIPPMFYLTYLLGTRILGSQEAPDLTVELSWEWITAQGAAIWTPLLTGSLVAGIVSGLVAYLLILYLWRWKVIKNWEYRKQVRLRKKRLSLQASAQQNIEQNTEKTTPDTNNGDS
jgi:uncharacterized protein (DUF2062 family)